MSRPILIRGPPEKQDQNATTVLVQIKTLFFTSSQDTHAEHFPVN